MRQKIDDWYNWQEAIGLSCTLGPAGASYALCRVKRQKDNIDILDRKHVETVEELFGYLKAHRQLPIALHVQGKGVLIKATSPHSSIGKDDIVQLFPNYRQEDYIYSYFAGSAQGWLTLVKIAPLEDVLSHLRAEKLAVIRLFVGPFVAEQVLDQLNGYSGNFAFDGHHIQRSVQEKKWESYRYAAEEKAKFAVKVQGAEMPERYVLAYATAFSLLMHQFVPDLQAAYPPADEAFADFRQRVKFKKNSLLLLLSMFVLLLINTALYSHYQGQYETIDYQAQEHFSNAAELQKLSAKAQSNDSLLLALGWNGGLHKSWLLNQLAVSLQGHSGIAWQSVIINPIAAKRYGAAAAEPDNRFVIQLTGACQTLNELEAWVRNLGQLYWVRQVEISKFIDQNKPNSTGKDFVINMHYTYDF